MNPGLAAHSLALHLKKKRISLACAESCTGGMAAAALTEEPGTSDFFLGCVVAYAKSAKNRVLGVPAQVIETYGAVSSETAVAMAGNAKRLFGADCAFSITGIAGPDGGSRDKPVGTVWFGFAVGDEPSAEMRVFEGDRGRVRRDATSWALDHLRYLLCQSNELDNTL
jgi:PncC family amidohydrolase